LGVLVLGAHWCTLKQLYTDLIYLADLLPIRRGIRAITKKKKKKTDLI